MAANSVNGKGGGRDCTLEFVPGVPLAVIVSGISYVDAFTSWGVVSRLRE